MAIEQESDTSLHSGRLVQIVKKYRAPTRLIRPFRKDEVVRVCISFFLRSIQSPTARRIEDPDLIGKRRPYVQFVCAIQARPGRQRLRSIQLLNSVGRPLADRRGRKFKHILVTNGYVQFSCSIP